MSNIIGLPEGLPQPGRKRGKRRASAIRFSCFSGMAARCFPKAGAAGGPVGFVCGRGMRKSVLYSLGLITRAQMAFTRLFMPMASLVSSGKAYLCGRRRVAHGDGLPGVDFRDDGDALDVFARSQGTEHPDELVNRFCLVLLVISDGGQQALHEGFIRQADQAELVRNA